MFFSFPVFNTNRLIGRPGDWKSDEREITLISLFPYLSLHSTSNPLTMKKSFNPIYQSFLLQSKNNKMCDKVRQDIRPTASKFEIKGLCQIIFTISTEFKTSLKGLVENDTCYSTSFFPLNSVTQSRSSH